MKTIAILLTAVDERWGRCGRSVTRHRPISNDVRGIGRDVIGAVTAQVLVKLGTINVTIKEFVRLWQSGQKSTAIVIRRVTSSS